MKKKFIKSKLIKIIPKSLIYKRYIRNINKHQKYNNIQIENIISNQYIKIFNRELHWDNPITYTEKLNVSKLYNSSKLKRDLTDKITVREWIAKKIGPDYLIPLISTYDSFSEIDFAHLPKKFVIKCNHDSGSVTVCEDKSKLNLKYLEQRYDKFFLKRNYAYINFEMQYYDIKPKVIIEKYMGSSISDYKFICFNGKPYYCWVDTNRFSNHKRNVYDMNWNLQEFNQYTFGIADGVIEKPKAFETMKKIASILSQGFDHVRVDLYEVDGKIYFGEMTFTNGNGMEQIVPDKFDYVLGKLWNFSSKRSFFEGNKLSIMSYHNRF